MFLNIHRKVLQKYSRSNAKCKNKTAYMKLTHLQLNVKCIFQTVYKKHTLKIWRNFSLNLASKSELHNLSSLLSKEIQKILQSKYYVHVFRNQIYKNVNKFIFLYLRKIYVSTLVFVCVYSLTEDFTSL